ncbi:MAG: hypothetical protein PF545_05475, partial [Elusimicrobia bacterium]|nr:hypothetical protein [Elusimicrobiota bacterium]
MISFIYKKLLILISFLLIAIPMLSHGALLGDVAITEVIANPLVEDEGDFIEIYNLTNKSIDVADWTIGEIGSTDTITTWDLGNDGGT